ncbi:hypothetical protein DIZ70_12110 [Acinetobacter junii]|uniref:hypothetical protein n=1 Tax=Acinetobacter junii TaxID=40215 RepID=UPI0010A9F1DD|nr:hypothetical protein [Acinetobacter junii]TIE03535.1 hypothetical protein DIZ70_12110 [Acinetobacter junii]
MCSSPLTITLSPTETPVSGKITTTSTLPFVISSGVIKPSPSPITISFGAVGAVVSTVAVSVTGDDVLPAGSLIEA